MPVMRGSGHDTEPRGTGIDEARPFPEIPHKL